MQIYDIEQGKQVGRLPFYGEFKHFELKGNLLLLITNNGVNDYYTFLVLDSNPVTNRPLVLNKAVYEKGKTDCYAMINMSTTDTNYIVERKKSIEVNFLPVTQISIDTSSVIFTLSKAKEKIEIIRLDHSKLLKSPFVDEKIDFVVFPTATTVANENAVISQ